MPDTVTKTIFAPAKINLFLHLTGRLPNGYHTLDSLVVFADIGDKIHISNADQFSFSITGPFSKKLLKEPGSTGLCDDQNLVVRAAKKLAEISGNALKINISLEKNLPIASGIGGGSSDCAATIWGLCELWDIPKDAPYIAPFLKGLGADVPVCFYAQAQLMRGIGERLCPAPDMPEVPAVLINPNKSCSTADIFTRHNRLYKTETTLPNALPDIYALSECLKQHDNDLYTPAIQVLPVIENIIHSLHIQNGCHIARMSGSGATCFGLFETLSDAQNAAQEIEKENPDWWIVPCMLNTLSRY